MSVTPANGDGKPNHGSDVGLTFVELMFAVAVGDAASQLGKVAHEVRQSPADHFTALWQVSPSITHLVLVLLVIAASWVGWYHSAATREYMSELKPIFSPRFPYLLAFPFVMLLVDVFLVVCYFILSEGAELPTYDERAQMLALKASVKAEAFWLMVIMATYGVWNLLYSINEWMSSRMFWGGQRGWRVAAALLSFGIILYAYLSKADVTATGSVVCVDVALAAAVFLFRLRLVDEQSRMVWWDWARAAGLVAISIILIQVS